jgi:anthranilate synthase component 2
MSHDILVLDNYDSFTYNLVHLLQGLGCEVEVVRNDKVDIETAVSFDGIVLSPGPGIPAEAGRMPELVAKLAPVKPILGVCLGHQCIGETFGAKLLNMPEVIHGKATKVQVCAPLDPLFYGLPYEFAVGRYHSWIVDRDSLPTCLRITALDEDGRVMALCHEEYNIRGVQFHPESVLTPNGAQIITNWLKLL